MQKRICSLLLSVIMLLTLLSMTAFAAIDEPVTSGECGDGVIWSYESDPENNSVGTLTISYTGSGTGKMDDFTQSYNRPWKYPLKQVIIEDGVTSIGDNAFYRHDHLTNVIIPDSLMSIGRSAFQGCKSLISINIPDQVTSIGGWAFYGCNNLTSITIPGSVTTIEDLTFGDCTSLSDVTISNGVLAISYRSFSGCNNLTSLYIPASVIRIENNVLTDCKNLAQITVDSQNTQYSSYQNALYNKERTILHFCPNGITHFNIPDTVTKISGFAFGLGSSLKEVSLSKNVDFLGGTFSYCTKLTTVIIPEGVSSLSDTFSGCTSLTEISLPASLTRIYSNTFANCLNLKTIRYAGTQSQWNQINIDSENPEIARAQIIFSDDNSSTDPTDPIDPITPIIPDTPVTPFPDDLTLSTSTGGFGTRVSLNIEGGHWLTIQVRRAGSIAITSVQAPGSGLVTMSFSAPAGSMLQVWETEDEMTFTNGIPSNPILSTATKAL